VRYFAGEAERPAVPAATVTSEPRPSMVLRAIAGGPPWQALIEGLGPPSGATLVRPGMVVDRVAVRSISRDTVVLRGLDTTWVLTFARRE
jgi:hypothetical protein